MIVHGKNLSACMVIHDIDLAMRFCDKAVILSDGEVRAAGVIEDVVTPELMRDVFGVDAAVEELYGRKRVIIL